MCVCVCVCLCVAVTLGIAGITCVDFDATVYDLAVDSIIKNATFSDATCADAPKEVNNSR